MLVFMDYKNVYSCLPATLSFEFLLLLKQLEFDYLFFLLLDVYIVYLQPPSNIWWFLNIVFWHTRVLVKLLQGFPLS
jgi:hypothetical protein